MKTDIHTPLPQVSTLSGELCLINPDPSRIHAADILMALGHENRYGGHSFVPVSVLQHSITVWLFAFLNGRDCTDQRIALWHDASEAYLKDLPRPLKKLLGELYRQIEERFEKVIKVALDLSPVPPGPWLKEYDNLALACECRLYRPREAFEDWDGLPPTGPREHAVAGIARRIAGSPHSGLFLLDKFLQAGMLSGVQRFVTHTFGAEWHHGAWKEVAE